MDRPVGLSSRDLAALAQPLLSHCGEMERSRQDSANPGQVLKLLGLLGDIAHASIQAQAAPPQAVPRPQPQTQPRPPSQVQTKAPVPAPMVYGTQRPEYQGMAPMLKDQKLVEALLELRKKDTRNKEAEEKDGFLLPQFPKVEAEPKSPLAPSRPPGIALPILRPPRR